MIEFKAYSPLLKTHFETPPAERMYHYTSPESLIGVLSNKELWASHALFMNDALEVKHGIQVAQELIEMKLMSERDEVIVDFLTQMRAALRDKGLGVFRKKAYIISFTEAGDSLPQWRGYCPASGGYVIGIPTAQIKDMADEQEFELVKCIYGIDLQRNILSEIIDAAAVAFKKNMDEGDSPDSFNVNQEYFFDYFLIVCSTMKHASFREEHEWRLVLLRSEDSNQSLFFRAGNKGVIPYCKFKLLNSNYSNLAERDGVEFLIRIGPSPNREERVIAASMMLKHYLNLDALPSFSDVPYQTW